MRLTEVEAAFDRLHKKRLQAPEPGDPARIRMAPPMLNLNQLWYLAVTWYSNRLTVDSRRPAPDEMVETFAKIGLTGPFWDPQADQWHGHLTRSRSRPLYIESFIRLTAARRRQLEAAAVCIGAFFEAEVARSLGALG
jgi:hypothetical protein